MQEAEVASLLREAILLVAKIAGPPLANRLFAATGGFNASLAVAAVSLVAGVVIFLVVKRVAPARA